MSNIYSDFNRWGYVDDNAFIPKNQCFNNIDSIKEVITEIIEEVVPEIKEKDDKLYVGDKEVMVDDYVKSGTYNGDGTATLQVGEDKTATIENLPKPMSTEEVEQIINKE